MPSPVLLPAPSPRRVLVVSGSVGAGHDGAARELAARLTDAGIEVEVRDYLAAVPRVWAGMLRRGYTWSVDRAPSLFEWLFRRVEDSRVVQTLALLACRLGTRRVRRWLRTTRPDLVVSTYPLASQCLGRLRATDRLGVPVVTYLTDPAAHRTWVHRDVDVHLSVTAATATAGQAAYGVPVRAAGPLVPARFRAPLSRTEHAALRRALHLPAGRPVALLVAGSLGIGDVVPSARHLAAAGVVPVVLCGRSDALRRKVAAVPGAVALGWRDDVHALMQVADVLVHNAGGLTFTEALVAGLPAVSYRCIPGHGVANATVLEAGGLAPWARDADELAALVHRAAQVGRLAPPELGDPAEAVLALLGQARPATTSVPAALRSA